MTLDELKEKIAAVERLSEVHYYKFETADNVASELNDILDDWENDEDIDEPDIADFAPNQIEDYHFECLAHSEAQSRLSRYPDAVENVLRRVDMKEAE